MLGILATESMLRQSNYLRRGGCNVLKNNKMDSHPLAIWTEQDIWSYIHKFNIPYADIYNHNVTRTGCMFCGFGCTFKGDNRFRTLYQLYPRIYEMCMNYSNNNVTYREALQSIGVSLPDWELF